MAKEVTAGLTGNTYRQNQIPLQLKGLFIMMKMARISP